ncbi:hypothetical protein ACFLXO_01085 [Chloroflexota bacterium]
MVIRNRFPLLCNLDIVEALRDEPGFVYNPVNNFFSRQVFIYQTYHLAAAKGSDVYVTLCPCLEGSSLG